jgi:hypothetical protein
MLKAQLEFGWWSSYSVRPPSPGKARLRPKAHLPIVTKSASGAAETAGSGRRADPEAPGSAGEIDPGPAQSAPCGGGAGEGAVSFDQEPIGGHDEGVVGIINLSDDRDGGGRE